jgi:hypothetical protein
MFLPRSYNIIKYRNLDVCDVNSLEQLTLMFYNSRTAATRLFRCAKRWQHSSAKQTLNSVTPDDIVHFAQFLPSNAILSTLSPISVPSSEIEQFNTDWMGKYRGSSTTVLRPQTTEQVSKIMKRCHERRIGVVPQGGNTGLVGGSVPLKDELILNLSNMSKVRSFDPVSGASYVHRAVWFCSSDNPSSCSRGARGRRWMHSGGTHGIYRST